MGIVWQAEWEIDCDDSKGRSEGVVWKKEIDGLDIHFVNLEKVNLKKISLERFFSNDK